MKIGSRFAFAASAVLLMGLAPPASPAASHSAANAGAERLRILDGDLRPLIKRFNRDAGRPRVLALLSPT